MDDVEDFNITKQPFSTSKQGSFSQPKKQSFSGSNSSNDSLDFSEIFSNFLCCECGETFTLKSNLKRHEKNFHPDKVHESKFSNSLKFKCNSCPRKFSHEKNLKRHMNVSHGYQRKPYTCQKCNQNFNKKEMMKHLAAEHNICIEEKTLSFDTLEEFQQWKSAFEKETTSKYIKRTETKTKKGVINYFTCHRSGYYSAKGKGIRRLKKKGSNKINGFCPAKIIAYENSCGKFDVKYINAHFGHDLGNLNHLTQNEEENKMIKKRKLICNRHKSSKKLSLEIIKNDDGFFVQSSSKLDRHFVQKVKDVCNCELICSDCKVCIHKYSCSCIDSAIRKNMCKHIHFLCSYLKSAEHPEHQLLINETVGEDIIVQEISLKNKTVNHQDLEMRKIIAIQNFTKLINSIRDPEQMCFIEKNVKYLTTSINVMKNSENSFNRVEISDADTNKKIVPPKRKIT